MRHFGDRIGGLGGQTSSLPYSTAAPATAAKTGRRLVVSAFMNGLCITWLANPHIYGSNAGTWSSPPGTLRRVPQRIISSC